MASYSYFIPSREAILITLRTAEQPLALDALCDIFSLDTVQQEGFLKRLSAMERDGQVKIDSFGHFQAEDTSKFIAGRVQAHRDGFGFLIRDDGEADLFLPFAEMQKVMHNDRVLASSVGHDRRGRVEVRIVEVTEHANRYVVGRLFNENGQWLVRPENQRFRQDITLSDSHQAKAGQIVTVELQTFPGRHLLPSGKIVEILGEAEESGMEIEIAVRQYGIPHEFSKATLAQAALLPNEVVSEDHIGRTDLRALPFVTIDGEDARDFDDAVYGELLSDRLDSEEGSQDPSRHETKRPAGGFRLYVAIADVSHYVRSNDALDRDALERSTSVYFPRRVVPMLPEKLSNGLCSLNPHVDRCALVCDMVIDAQGRLQSHQFYPALIHSAARLTYTTVAQVLEDKKKQSVLETPALLPHLQVLHSIYKALLKARQKRGAMEFETTETKIICNAQGKIESIVPSVRNIAHKLIEECMLAANVCAAKTLKHHHHPGLYRVHAQPDPDKLTNLRRFLGLLGLSLGGGERPTAKDYAVLMDHARAQSEKTVDISLLQTMLLRSMQQAVYSPDNEGHFGLAYEEYTHFTSPIRRYPDLLTHRALYAILAGKKYHPHYEPEMTLNASAVSLQAKTEEIWYQLGQHCSANERRADDASRDVEAWLKCYFMRDKVGEIYSGSVNGVTSFGLFVQLDELFVDGLIHVTELGDDYFQYDEVKNALIAERSGISYRLLDRLTVQVARVDLSARKIDFRLIDASVKTKRRKANTSAMTPPDSTKKRPKSQTVKKSAGKADLNTEKSSKIAASAKSVKAKPKAISKKVTSKTAPKAKSKKVSKTTPKVTSKKATPKAAAKTKTKKEIKSGS